ncbi:MAG: hypothetical protein M5U09_10210 [Gammaproteobacteria bacterium]|nr:hypothetical protein [Gammaproteobacteria bacterium]
MTTTPTTSSSVVSSITVRILTPTHVPARMAMKHGQNRLTTCAASPPLEACHTLASTTGIAISTTAVCGGITSAMSGTVRSGVPTPRAPLIRPPQASANAHQASNGNPISAGKDRLRLR